MGYASAVKERYHFANGAISAPPLSFRAIVAFAFSPHLMHEVEASSSAAQSAQMIRTPSIRQTTRFSWFSSDGLDQFMAGSRRCGSWIRESRWNDPVAVNRLACMEGRWLVWIRSRPLGIAFQDSGSAVRPGTIPPAPVGTLLRVSHLSHGPCHACPTGVSRSGRVGAESGPPRGGFFLFRPFFFGPPCIRSPLVSPLFRDFIFSCSTVPSPSFVLPISCPFVFVLTFLSSVYTSSLFGLYIPYLPLAPCG